MCALVTGVQTCALPIWIWPKRISCLFCNYIGRLRVLKKLLLAATAAAVFAGPVNAALFTVSGGAAVTPLDSDNNFKTDLEALGFDSLVSGPGLSVSFSDPFAKGFNVYVVGAESGYTNKFFVGGGEFTENNEAFDINRWAGRSEEHTSELQSLMRNS